MTNVEIIIKAVEKAVRNGYKPKGVMTSSLCSNEICMLKYKYLFPFHHEFAKAFWGEKEELFTRSYKLRGNNIKELSSRIAWQYHLQQMVLEENPIAYLERFL